MEFVVGVPHIWGDSFLVSLPAPNPKATQKEKEVWESNADSWIARLERLSPSVPIPAA